MGSGVSIVICCHNSAQRIQPTLEHLLGQQGCDTIPWEVLLVDNASIDRTVELAREVWGKNAPVRLNVISEPRLGLSNARMAGLAHSRYDMVSMIDDDNWVEPEWVKKLDAVVKEHPEAGVIGCRSTAVIDDFMPQWFDAYKEYYAVGSQAETTGDMTASSGWLWGAGLTVRKSAWLDLLSLGFRPLLADRTGKQLSSGGDVELCLALRLAGWKIWYQDDLCIEHFIPAWRLNWNYVRRLAKFDGISSVYLYIYESVYRYEISSLYHRSHTIWIPQTRRRINIFANALILRSKSLMVGPVEGNRSIVQFDYALGGMLEMLRIRAKYDQYVSQVYGALRRKAPVKV